MMASEIQRLQISSTVVGRDEEIAVLRQIYSSTIAKKKHEARQAAMRLLPDTSSSNNSSSINTSEENRCPAIYISGESGIGKSRLVQAAFEGEHLSSSGYFVTGKFDLIRSHRPFAAPIDALNALCAKVMERHGGENENKLTLLRRRIQQHVDLAGLDALVGMIPNLAKLLMRETREVTASEEVSHASIKQGFRKVKRTILDLIAHLIGPDEVLVLFIDDLQWANIDCIEIIEDIIATIHPTKCIFVGGYRSNEVDRDHILTLHLQDARKALGAFYEFELRGLSPADVVTFVADTLKRDEESVTALGEFVHATTNGNIFYVRQYLVFLESAGHLYFSLSDLRWDWDHTVSLEQPDERVTFSLEEAVSRKIKSLPQDTVDAIKLASCLGRRFDCDSIDFVSAAWRRKNCDAVQRGQQADHATIEEILYFAVEADLLEELPPEYTDTEIRISYRFTHDKVQDTAFVLIGEEKIKYHNHVGRCLVELYESTATSPPWMLIVGAEHLFKAQEMIVCREDQDRVAVVCYEAAKLLKSSSSFLSGLIFSQYSIQFLGQNPWDRDYYLALKIFNLAADIAFCQEGTQDQCEQLLAEILQNARTFQDKTNALYVSFEKLASRSNYAEALEAGMALMWDIKITKIPRKITKAIMLTEVIKTLALLRKFSEADLCTYRETDNPAVTLFCRAATLLSCSAHFANKKEEFVFLILRSLRVSLQHGYSASTQVAIMFSGMVCGKLKLFQLSMKLGRVGIAVKQRFNSPEADVFATIPYYMAIYYYDHQIKNYAEKHMEAYRLGLSCGFISGAFLNSSAATGAAYQEGSMHLEKFIVRTRKFIRACTDYGKELLIPNLRQYRQVAMNLMGRSPDASIMQGREIENYDKFVASLDPTTHRWGTALAMQLAAHFWDFSYALPFANSNAKMESDNQPLYFVLMNQFWRALIYFSLYQRGGKISMLKLARKEYKKLVVAMKRGWKNTACFVRILEAEMDTQRGVLDVREAQCAYDAAIAETEVAGFRQYIALAQERAGCYFAKLDTKECNAIAKAYIMKSIQEYTKWRAFGKVMLLQRQFLHILGPDTTTNCSTATGSDTNSFESDHLWY